MNELRLAPESLEELYTVIIAVDYGGEIRHASETVRRYIDDLQPGVGFFDHLKIIRPGSVDSIAGLFSPPASLFLIQDRKARFAARGQIIILRWDDEELACFCGSPWLFWMNSHCPETKLGMADFPPQDSQLDQLFLMSTEQRMVADLEKLNRELRVAKRAAEDAQAAKSALFARMSHEMRTPLNGVVSALALLADKELSGDARKLLDLAHSSSRNLLHVINYVLDISKLDAGETELDPVVFNLSGLMKTVTDIVRARAVEKGLELSWHASPQLSDAYVGDKAKLRQCLLNLVNNAIKFTGEGAVSLRAAPSGAGGSPMLRLEVEDTGMGIREDDQKHIFEPFWTGGSELPVLDSGTGLGLDIVRRNVEAMGGTMGVVSRYGKGSLFWIELPLEPGDEENLAGAHPGEHRIPGKFRGRVLLVDDNETNLLLGRMILESMGISVQEARDGAAAVSRCHGEVFDLVLMDISMPGMDGITATREIRKFASRSELPVVALTAYASSEERDRCLELGMNDYLTKPIVRDRLAEHLSTWLRADEERPDTPEETPESDAQEAPVLDEAVLNLLRQQIGAPNLAAVLDQFSGEVTHRWTTLRTLWAGNESEDLLREVHTLSSTCRSLGLAAAGAHFASLEERLRDGGTLSDGDIEAAETILGQGHHALRGYGSDA